MVLSVLSIYLLSFKSCPISLLINSKVLTFDTNCFTVSAKLEIILEHLTAIADLPESEETSKIKQALLSN